MPQGRVPPRNPFAQQDDEQFVRNVERLKQERLGASAETERCAKCGHERKAGACCGECSCLCVPIGYPAPAPQPAQEGKWQAHYDAAQAMIVALCKPRGSEGSREWVMSIPAREDRDPDLVIGNALRAMRTEIERLSRASGPAAAEDRCQSEHHPADILIEYQGEKWCDICFTTYADKATLEAWEKEHGIEKPTPAESAECMRRVAESLSKRAEELAALAAGEGKP